jgi:hypothetical protein
MRLPIFSLVTTQSTFSFKYFLKLFIINNFFIDVIEIHNRPTKFLTSEEPEASPNSAQLIFKQYNYNKIENPVLINTPPRLHTCAMLILKCISAHILTFLLNRIYLKEPHQNSFDSFKNHNLHRGAQWPRGQCASLCDRGS